MLRVKLPESRNLSAGTERRPSARLVQVLFPVARLASNGPSSAAHSSLWVSETEKSAPQDSCGQSLRRFIHR